MQLKLVKTLRYYTEVGYHPEVSLHHKHNTPYELKT